MSEKDIRISYEAARVNSKMSQAEAAKELNVSLKTIQNYESGRTSPNWDMHNRMATLYGIPCEMLSPKR